MAKRRTIGEQLRLHRERLHITVEQAADRSGLTVKTIQRIESGNGGLFSTLKQYAAGFGKRIAVRDFYVPLKVNISALSRQWEMDESTIRHAFRTLNSPENGAADHIGRDGETVVLKGEDMEINTLEFVLGYIDDNDQARFDLSD